MYDIMYDIMISCYDIIYDIICIAFLALYDIVKKLWYHTWYHILKYDIIYDIIKTIIKSLSCAILLWFRLLYHIHFIRFCPWYQYYVISMPYDITDLMISQPMSWYLRGGTARVGGARRQVLHRLQPRRRQHAGDVCSTEQWRPWSRAWTCCIGCCASNAPRPICSH